MGLDGGVAREPCVGDGRCSVPSAVQAFLLAQLLRLATLAFMIRHAGGDGVPVPASIVKPRWDLHSKRPDLTGGPWRSPCGSHCGIAIGGPGRVRRRHRQGGCSNAYWADALVHPLPEAGVGPAARAVPRACYGPCWLRVHVRNVWARWGTAGGDSSANRRDRRRLRMGGPCRRRCFGAGSFPAIAGAIAGASPR